MKKLGVLALILLPLLGSAQLFEGEEFEYTREWIWGFNKNTNGGLIGGVMIRHSRKKADDVYHTFGLELSNVKHPSESRYIGLSGAGFIYGKSNYLYAIRTTYGLEKLMYRKANQQGVQISFAGAAGPTFGLVTPYYVLSADQQYDQFSLIKHPSPQSIAGPGKIFQGLNESDFAPGLNAKGSVFFEFGTYRSNVAGVEVGVLAEAFTKEIVLVPSQPNKTVFTSVFFTLFWGTRK
ncbi:hypothetical protein SAMN05421640_0290 [Ekhidna lutea]|uniref:Outer membrane protein beta-barrel domain-containing protein n=1 Tax=Ekhidna lutea TaxID=447679 RepID=A0A239ERG1_EKHLU|nr:hypothetical protein [Ekhidna lutea]SNS47225.1 hypothetical protein SAMN05421640_0290 [Ekhidna lutea]